MNDGSAEHLTSRKKLVFVLLLLVFNILLTEMGLQAFYRLNTGQWLWQWWAVPLYESDSIRVYRLKSNLNYLHKTSEYSTRYYTNAQGFRTDRDQTPTSMEKPTNTYRVMYLGPSFTFGWGVAYEKSYASLISEGLHVRNKRIETINVGTPAQPINYQLAWLEKEGYRYAPDIIIQTVYLDCCMNMAADGTFPKVVPYVEGGYLYPPPPKTFGESICQKVNEYRRYSALLFFGWRMYVELAAGKETIGMGDELYEKPSGYDVCNYGMIIENYHAYQRFVWGSLGREVPIVFVYIPLAYIVRPADIIRVKHQGKYKDPFEERSNSRRVQQMLNDNGIHFVDLTDALVQDDEKKRMYYLYDIHFTPEGNQVAAKTATPAIQQAIDDSLIGGERKTITR